MKEEFGIERIPCCYWLLSLLKRIKPESLGKCLMKRAKMALHEGRKGITVSLDGKTIRSTCKVVSAFATECGLVLGQLAREEKVMRSRMFQNYWNIWNCKGVL